MLSFIKSIFKKIHVTPPNISQAGIHGHILYAGNYIESSIASNRSIQRIQRLQQFIKEHPSRDTSKHQDEINARVEELKRAGISMFTGGT